MLLFKSLLISIIAFAFTQAALAQAPPSNELALEVYFYPKEPPAYQKIYKGSSGGAWYARFHQIKSTSDNDLPVNAVDIKPSFSESGINVTVSVLFGEL